MIASSNNRHLKAAYLLELAATGTAFLFIGIMAFLVIESAVDDAFIVYRYVDRFLEHKGLTYNDGEYVEGFTSLLWTLLLSGIGFLGIRPHIASVGVNYVSILLCAFSMIWLLQTLNIGRPLRIGSMFLLGVSILYFKVVFLGLEFGLFVLLLILFLGFFLHGLDYPHYIRTSKSASLLSGLLGAALFATRPEAIVLLPASLLVTCLFQRQEKSTKAHLAYAASSFAVFLTSIIVWRLFYYGEFLPNSVIAKSFPLSQLSARVASFSRLDYMRGNIACLFESHITNPARLCALVPLVVAAWESRGWILGSTTYLLEAYITNPALLFVLVLLVVAVWKKWRVFELSLLSVPILWQHIIIIENGGDWMEYSRFVTMYVPLFIIGFALVAGTLWQQSRAVGAACLLVFSGLYLYGNIPHLSLTERTFLERSRDSTDSYQAIGEVLHDVWLEGDILIAEAVGRIAYVMPNAYIHDPHGLMDKTLARDKVARRSVYGRGNWRYSLDLGPAVIVLHSWTQQREWTTFGIGYPEQFAFYCLPPLPEMVHESMVYLVVRQDRVARYGSALMKLGAQQVVFEDFKDPKLAQPLMCGSDR